MRTKSNKLIVFVAALCCLELIAYVAMPISSWEIDTQTHKSSAKKASQRCLLKYVPYKVDT